MPTYLDTHTWIWWVTQDRRLSKRALSIIQNSVTRDGVWISAISIWEIAKKTEKRQLVLDRPLRQWLDLAIGIQGLHVAELTTAILIESCELPPPFPGDPADQIIAATVRHHSAKLITKDRELHRYPHLQCVW